ncbi:MULTISPECIES: FAD/NAD(P)-binding protein [unclassified Pseudomonas]|uniref:FAD/NAD(P)-binding protein n=1 Tax=unclassified Pseudomonas TaxID=196821 RepID=UPI00131432AE|nr:MULTISPECIES: FAD/NAD(P)-binding protein [unclassified Pseudomonas]
MELSASLRFVRDLHERQPIDDRGAAIQIGIVGCGSRGLTVLERLCAVAAHSERRVAIHVFEPRQPGPGLHSVDQPAWLMLNTVASQISMFPDSAALNGLAGRTGPNFYEWCLRYKAAERVVRPDEFLPRAWLGEYLAWTYREVLRTLPTCVDVIHHPHAVDNIEHTDTGAFVLSTDDRQRYHVDWLLITIGHAEPPAAGAGLGKTTQRVCAYPQAHASQTIASTQAVGIEGMGLSAMDAVAQLTVGRGGRFIAGPAGLTYQPSGEEPRLFMYSRRGLPYWTRPDIVPHRLGAAPLIFTLSAVADLRARHPIGLDFECQVLPLIKAEMAAEYFGMVASLRGESSLRVKSEIATAHLLGEIEPKLHALARMFGVSGLDPMLFDPGYSTAPVENYGQWVKSMIEADLQQSSYGLDHSPIKAAAEVWRSCREQLRRIVDNQGLSRASHRVFFDEYAPLVNRMVAGPQKERHQELLALANAGILDWVHPSHVTRDPESGDVVLQREGESATSLDVVISAHVSPNLTVASQPAIIRQLRESGIIHSGDGNDGLIHIDSHGRAQPNLWITGPIVEGATYYNHYVPSSGSYSRAFVDADRIAREMLGMMVPA